MKHLDKLLILVAALLLTAASAAAGPAADLKPGSYTEDQLLAAGWEQAESGIWQRTTEDGRVQTMAQGQSGMIAMLDELRGKMVNLVGAYLQDPTDEMQQVLDTHLALIERVEQGILKGEPPRLGLKAAAECKTAWDADAGGSSSSCSNFAKASASYNGTSERDCFGACYIYTYAYVSRTQCSGTQYTASQSCNDSGINISCGSSVSLSQNGLTSCYASADAYVYCPDISWIGSDYDTSTSCGHLCLFCVHPGNG